MIPIIYESTETAFVSNGLGRLRDAISVVVSEERNGIFECDFSYPVDGANFDLIKCGRVIAVTHDDSGMVEPFDIVSFSKPINGIVTFHAVHVSYRLRGIVARSTNINSLAAALQAIENTAQPSASIAQFTFEKDFDSTGYMAAFDGVPRSVRQLLGGIDGSILDTYGGEWEFTGFRAILHRARGSLRDFTVRYGLNLLNYTDDTDYSSTYTSCIPYWVGVDGTGGETVVVGNKVSSGSPSYSDKEICAPLDLTDKFEDKPTTAQLQSMAASYMSANQVYLPAQTISVDFVRLQDMGEFAEFEDLLQCNLCDSINVVFPRYNMQGTFKIVKTVYNVLKDRYDGMELGALSSTLADALGITQTAESINTITDFAISGDLAVGGDASIIGDVAVGNLTIDGHSSPIGSSQTGSNESASIANGTAYIATGEEFTLTAGTWLITAGIRFNTNATGARRICIRDVTGAANVARSRNSTNALSSYQTDLSTSCTVSVGSTGRTYAVYAQQNSGSALGAAVYWMYVRIA